MCAHHWEDEPSPFIQEIARAYCEDRPLYRPDTTYLKVAAKWLLIAGSVFLVFFACAFLVLKTGLPDSLTAGRTGALIKESPARAMILFALAGTLISALLLLRWFAIDCVKLYQHYAPEEVRRRCILMPSCSEFAILAFRRYGFIIGGAMTWYRLHRRCRGTINRIEYP